MDSSVALIPRQLIFGNPQKAMPAISPDGSQISFLAPHQGVLNIWVAPALNPAAAVPVTNDTTRGIRFYTWAFTSRHILYIQDKGGDENWRLYVVDLANATTTDLTPIEGIQARIQEVSPHFPTEVLVGLNDRDRQLHDLYRVDLLSGQRSLVAFNEGFVGFTTDDHFKVRLASRMTPMGGMEMLKPTQEGDWELFQKVGPEDVLTTTDFGFDQSGHFLYMGDSRGRDTSALFKLDMDSGSAELLAEDPRADLERVIIHPTERTLQAAIFDYDRKTWQVLDASIAPDLEVLRGVSDGDLSISSRTLDDRVWIVGFGVDAGAPRYYRYDRSTRQADFLFTTRPELEGKPLAQMHPVIIPSRDGMNLVSYYTLPVDRVKEGSDRPDQPLPLVLFVHGGPWARDVWGYHSFHQWLANRGYAVLSVNFRGSTGFGKAFTNAGNLEWGAKMHADLVDAVQWAVSAGIADPAKVAIMGGSYGGYATLVGLTFTPDLFACGVDIVGPSNLVTLLETIPPYWAPMLQVFTTRVGDHRSEQGRAFLTSRSPLSYVDQIRKPLLIGQGANDPRVKQAEADQIVQAMQARGIPVTYLLYPDEGHGFARPENNLSFNAVTEAFFSRWLGGRCEPFGSDLNGSSLQVQTGAEFVPNLGETLQTR
jgi:dipeptidyl aminopeptidase/acylaminoacyl peptidase